jgi:hypothetical protein
MEHLWSIIATLLGVGVGGFGSYFASRNLERERWRQQRRDKLDEARRPAIEGALAWLDPMYLALMNAEGEMYALLGDDDGDQKFRQTYPNLLNALVKLGLTPHHQLLVPSGTYQRGQRIQYAFDQLKYEALDLWEKTRYPKHAPAMNVGEARFQCSEKVKAMKEEVDALRQGLEEAYRKTYE